MAKTVENPELNIDLMFPSKYLKAADLQGKDVTLTIETVKGEDLQMTNGTKEHKYVIAFVGTPKMLVLNKTNAKSIAAALGEKRAVKWAGQRITLFPTECSSFGKIVDCIRVKEGK
jgi:hypothetical protein